MKQFLRAQLQIQSLSTASSCGMTGHGDVIPPLSDLTFGIFMSLPKTEQLLFIINNNQCYARTKTYMDVCEHENYRFI